MVELSLIPVGLDMKRAFARSRDALGWTCSTTGRNSPTL